MENFSDDGFDELNDNALQELENNALHFTQANFAEYSGSQPVAAPDAPAYLEHDYVLVDDDLDDAIVIDELAQKPGRPAAPSETSLPPPQQPRPAAPGFAGQPRWSQQAQQYPRTSRPIAPPRPPPPTSSQRFPTHPLPHARPPPSQFGRPQHPASRVLPNQTSAAPHRPVLDGDDDDHVVARLQARLRAMEAELNSARGEASILRRTTEKANAMHDAEVARLKKQNSEQLARKERLVEDALAAEQQAATELQFTRQDLRDELGRTKPKKKDGAVTPKKSKKWGMGDGFDDLELLPSPSKGQGQRRRDPGPVAVSVTERTPTKGKRKRPVIDSPIQALETHSELDAMVLDHDDAKPVDEATHDMVKRNSFFHDFHKLVMAHGSMHGQPLTFELFSRYALPSKPGRSFASIILGELARVSVPDNPLDLLVDFSYLIIDLWVRSLAEKYYPPIYDLAALLFFTLQLNATAVAPRIISSLLPVAQETCLVVAEPRFKGESADFASDIDVTQCLSVVYLSALGCLGPPAQEATASADDDAEPTVANSNSRTKFWMTMRHDFVMFMLSTKQPESDFHAILSLLCTSTFPTSIGPIPPPAAANSPGSDAAAPPTSESIGRMIVDQISMYLAQPFPWAAPGSAKLCEGRLAVLRTLTAFSTSPFGALLIASSRTSIPRMVTLLSWAIDKLYDMDVPTSMWNITRAQEGERGEPNTPTNDGQGGEVPSRLDESQAMEVDSEPAGKKQPLAAPPHPVHSPPLEQDLAPLLFRIISRTVVLLHTLITDPRTGNAANISTKLATNHGGPQRYQLTLARLNFAEEDLVLEAGVDAETIELAHDLLELFVTPEDGEAVGEVFGV